MGHQSFPWELLKAQSLRGICRDLHGSTIFNKRDDMISFLKLIEENGLDAALKVEAGQESRSPKPEVTPKRKREQSSIEKHDYNTRHREKRARVSDPRPRVPRRKPVRRKEVVRGKPSSPSKTLGSDQRGRREVFDGVLVPSKPVSAQGKGKGRQTEEDSSPTPVVLPGMYGSEDSPEEDMPMVEDFREASALSDSNKENFSLQEDFPERDESEEASAFADEVNGLEVPDIIVEASEETTEISQAGSGLRDHLTTIEYSIDIIAPSQNGDHDLDAEGELDVSPQTY